jgi:hypothetical protein
MIGAIDRTLKVVGIRHGMEILLVEWEDDIEEDRTSADWRRQDNSVGSIERNDS